MHVPHTATDWAAWSASAHLVDDQPEFVYHDVERGRFAQRRHVPTTQPARAVRAARLPHRRCGVRAEGRRHIHEDPRRPPMSRAAGHPSTTGHPARARRLAVALARCSRAVQMEEVPPRRRGSARRLSLRAPDDDDRPCAHRPCTGTAARAAARRPIVARVAQQTVAVPAARRRPLRGRARRSPSTPVAALAARSGAPAAARAGSTRRRRRPSASSPRRATTGAVHRTRRGRPLDRARQGRQRGPAAVAGRPRPTRAPGVSRGSSVLAPTTSRHGRRRRDNRAAALRERRAATPPPVRQSSAATNVPGSRGRSARGAMCESGGAARCRSLQPPTTHSPRTRPHPCARPTAARFAATARRGASSSRRSRAGAPSGTRATTRTDSRRPAPRRSGGIHDRVQAARRGADRATRSQGRAREERDQHIVRARMSAEQAAATSSVIV